MSQLVIDLEIKSLSHMLFPADLSKMVFVLSYLSLEYFWFFFFLCLFFFGFTGFSFFTGDGPPNDCCCSCCIIMLDFFFATLCTYLQVILRGDICVSGLTFSDFFSSLLSFTCKIFFAGTLLCSHVSRQMQSLAKDSWLELELFL